MKSSPFSPLSLTIVVLLGLMLNTNPARAQAPAAEAQKKADLPAAAKQPDASTNTVPVAHKPLPADPEERFKFLFTKSYLAGRWAPLRDGKLGDEHGGDKYNIVTAIKGDGDNWIVSAKMKYRDREFVMPVPVKMKFVGDVAILTVDKLAIPGGGTYTARLLIYERTYSGTWTDARGGGMLYGTISHEE